MARKVADAVLYEGYVLFPYRAGTMKNQIRWQFGVVVPQAYTEFDASERSAMRTECLIDVGKDTEIDVKLRFLRVQDRTVEQAVDGGWVQVEAPRVRRQDRQHLAGGGRGGARPHPVARRPRRERPRRPPRVRGHRTSTNPC